MPADGSRAYLLTGPALGVGWSRRLLSVDLAGSAAGTVTQRWPLPGGCFALAMGPTEKVYVADLLGDRLWRADTRTNRFLGAVPLAGAPITIAARPV
jgi:hypothetical protein